MIHKLSGIHETVDFREDEQVCLYYNDEYENYPPHWHTSFEVLMPIVNGYKALCGGKEYNLREGDVLIIGPCMLHELFAPESGERIIFQPEGYPQIYEKVKTLMLEIKEEYFGESPYLETMIISKFLEILTCVGRQRVNAHTVAGQQKENGANSRQKEYVEKFILVTDYINNHFAEDLSLEGVASQAGFSKYHFSRLFKQYTDSTFYKYLNQKRIEFAKTLLQDPGVSVTEVAFKSGFSSLSAFLRMFKLMNNCTPTEFREMYDRTKMGN